MAVWGDTDLPTYRPTCQSSNSPIDMFKSNIPLHLRREAWPSPWHLREGLGGVGEWNVNIFLYFHFVIKYPPARRGGAEVEGWTLDWKIRVLFPAYPHRVWAFWLQGGKRRLRTSRCPCRGRLGTLKTPSCPWCGCPAAGQHLETYWTSVPSLYSWNIAECDVKPQSTTLNIPPWGPGVKSRMCPPYPRRVVKGD